MAGVEMSFSNIFTTNLSKCSDPSTDVERHPKANKQKSIINLNWQRFWPEIIVIGNRLYIVAKFFAA